MLLVTGIAGHSGKCFLYWINPMSFNEGIKIEVEQYKKKEHRKEAN